MDAILSGLPCEMVGSFIDRAIDFVVGQVAHSTTWKEWKTKHHLTQKENNFLDLYVEAVVAYFQKERPKNLHYFFRNQSVIEALYRHWYEGDSALPFYPTLQKVASHFNIDQQLGDANKAQEEASHFEKYFRAAVNVSRKVGEKEDHELLKKIDEKTDKLTGTGQLPHALTPNPFSPPVFIGRERELKELHQKLFAGQNFLLLVNGKGGMGKTSLASRYYHRYRDEYEHVAWVLSEKSIADALLLLAVTLGLDFTNTKLTIAERLQLLLAKLATLPKPCLLVIDNANEPADLSAHFKALRRCSNFHLLLTTRITKFDGADFFPVKGLDEKNAIALFKKYYKGHRAGEDELLKEIIHAIDHNTLIIELFAKNLQKINEFEPSYSLTELYTDIQKNLTALSQSETVRTAYQAKGTGLRHETPEAIVLAMYDVRALSDGEKQLISIFAVLPNEQIPYQALKKLLPGTDFKNALRLLTQKGWIDFDATQKEGKVNQVVQDVVKVKHNDRILSDAMPLIKELARELFRDDLIHKDNYEEALHWVRYAESIVDAIETPEYDVARLCQNIGNFHIKTGDLINAMDAYQKNGCYFQSAL